MARPAIILDIEETGVTAKSQSQTVKIARRSPRRRMATSPDSPIRNRDAEDLLRDVTRADRPLDVEVPSKSRATPADAPDGMPFDEPTPGAAGLGRRVSGVCEVRGIARDLGIPAPCPAALRLYDDMSQEQLNALREQRGYPNRDATSLLTTRLLDSF